MTSGQAPAWCTTTRWHRLGDNAPMDANPQKHRTGLNRLWHALGYSLSGLRSAWSEKAFRQEAWLAFILVPLAFWVGDTWVEVSLLVATVVLVLVAELLNTGIEALVDRVSPEWHALSKKAKDVGSAAVLLALLLCAGTWLAALTNKGWLL